MRNGTHLFDEVPTVPVRLQRIAAELRSQELVRALRVAVERAEWQGREKARALLASIDQGKVRR